MKLARLMTLAALFAALSLAPAEAGLALTLDPPNLHINGPGGFAQSAGGTDWVTLPTFNGVFNIQDVSNKSETIAPWHLIIAVPNFTGTLLDSITKVGANSVSISPLFDGNFTTGSVYDALGVTGSGVPDSLSFGNFAAAFTAVTGGPTPTGYGLYDFTIAPTTLALLSGVVDEIDLSGSLPAGSVLFAYGTSDDGTLFTTSFTNAGVVTPQEITPTPEPSTMISAMSAVVILGGIAWRRHRAARPTTSA